MSLRAHSEPWGLLFRIVRSATVQLGAFRSSAGQCRAFVVRALAAACSVIARADDCPAAVCEYRLARTCRVNALSSSCGRAVWLRHLMRLRYAFLIRTGIPGYAWRRTVCEALASPFSSSIGRSRVSDPVRAAVLLPFAVVLPGEDPEQMALAGGYVVFGADGGDSELRLYDPVAATFTATLAMLPERVRSVAFEHRPEGTLLYLLTGDGIRIYDSGSNAWQRLDAGRECTEIVLAR